MMTEEDKESNSSWNDSELESRYNKINGPPSETSYQFIRRSYQGLCDRICQPERRAYTQEDVQTKTDTVMRNYFNNTNINSLSHNACFQIHDEYISVPDFATNTVKFIFWENKANSQCTQNVEEPINFQIDMDETRCHGRSVNNSNNASNDNFCILYLHTNTRNLLEATEVLPICYDLNMHAVSFDLPGHGHTHSSNEVMSAALSLATIDNLISYIKIYYHVSHVILWARGMSTALAIEYCGTIVRNNSSDDVGNVVGAGIRNSESYVTTISDKLQSIFFPSPSKTVVGINRQLHPSHSCSDIYSTSSSSSYSPEKYYNNRSRFTSSISTSNMSKLSSAVSVSSELSSYSQSSSSSSSSSSPTATTTFKYPNVQTQVQLLILDTPFTSIQDITDDAVKTMQRNGYIVPKFLIDFGISIIKSSVTQRLGFDPYTIKPITFVDNIKKPVAILVASQDDYIRPQRCLEIQAKLLSGNKNHHHKIHDSNHNQSCQCCELMHFDGSHFSERPISILYPTLISFIQQHCRLEQN